MERRSSRIALIVSLAAASFLGAETARAEDAPPHPTEEVSITGTRLHESGGSAHALKDKQLRRFSYDDPHQVLMGVPGVYVRPEDGFGLRPNIGIRGASSDRSKKITLMEDGVLVGPAPYSAPAAYYFPMIDRMRTVRVVKGPSSILHGPQTVGGAIDLVTREIPTERKGTYDLGFGQYMLNKQHVTYGASDEKAGFLIEGIRLSNTGFKELDGGGDTGFTRSEWMAKASYLLDPRADVQNEIGVKLGYADERSNETYLGLTDRDFRANPDRRYRASALDRMDWHRTSIAVTHTARFSPRLEMTTTLYRNDLSRVWRKVNGFRGGEILDVFANPDTPRNQLFVGTLRGEVDSRAGDPQTILIGPNNRQFVSQGMQTQVRAAARTGPVIHRVTYGARAHYDSIDRLHTHDGFAMRGGNLVHDGRATETTADNVAATHALALWAVDAMSLGRLIVTPGVRIEAIHAAFRDQLTGVHDGATYQVVVPGANAYYGLTRELGLLAGVHRGFSPVPPEQARQSRPEKSTNYEAGARWSSRHVRAEAIGFYNDYQNLTNLCTFSSGCAQANIDRQTDGGRARIAGAEMYLETELDLGSGWRLPSRAAYTYTYTELLTNFQSFDPQLGDVRRGDEIPYVPPNQASGAIGVERERWGLNVAGTFVDSMRERAGQGTPAPGALTDAYFLLDASVKYKIIDHVELYLNGRNLTNERYIASRRPFGARPGAPLWFIVGLRGEF
jgi:Fe(3+) dicitrate transport protein